MIFYYWIRWKENDSSCLLSPQKKLSQWKKLRLCFFPYPSTEIFTLRKYPYLKRTSSVVLMALMTRSEKKKKKFWSKYTLRPSKIPEPKYPQMLSLRGTRRINLHLPFSENADYQTKLLWISLSKFNASRNIVHHIFQPIVLNSCLLSFLLILYFLHFILYIVALFLIIFFFFLLSVIYKISASPPVFAISVNS